MNDLASLTKSSIVDASSSHQEQELAEPTDRTVGLLWALAENGDRDARWRVASNNNAPHDLLAMLAEDIDWYVREAVASNRNTPAKILAALGKDVSRRVVLAVAKNPSSPPETLVRLAADKYNTYEMHLEITHNPSAPPDALQLIATDASPNMLRNVARHNATSKETLDQIHQYTLKECFEESRAGVLTLVAQHANTAPLTLFALTAYGDPVVSVPAQRNWLLRYENTFDECPVA